MNDFDRFLEFQLRQMLDPVVSTRPPRRRRFKVASRPVRAGEPSVAGIVVDAIAAAEPVPVAIVVTPLPQH